MRKEKECNYVVPVSKDSLWNLKRHLSQKHKSVLPTCDTYKKVIGLFCQPTFEPVEEGIASLASLLISLMRFSKDTVLLGCEPNQHHTAHHIYQKYENVLKYWHVEQCVIQVVTDSANNMIKKFNLLPAAGEDAEGANSSSAEYDEEEHDGAPALAQVQVEEITINVETTINHYFTMSELLYI